MLASLAVRDIVLIESCTLTLQPGLNALTGETGAGKSILLDALGLATGRRSERGLVRQGAAQGSATASFEVGPAHPARALLSENGIDAADEIILRRTLAADGRTRAFVNDQPVSVALLRDAGDLLLEVHGQHDDRGLLDPSGHRALLDLFGRLTKETAACAASFGSLKTARDARDAFAREAEAAQAQIDYLRHVVRELEELSPEDGEEERLASERAGLMAAEKFSGDVAAAADALSGDGLEARLAQALRRIERVRGAAAGKLDALASALDRALVEAQEAGRLADAALRDFRFDPQRLERIEERLFALRGMARKHRIDVAALPRLKAELAAKLDAAEGGAQRLRALDAGVATADAAWRATAGALTAARTKAAARLDTAVNKELKPLKLERARFVTQIAPLPDGEGGAHGADRVAFLVATNPGAAPGPLAKIASGGELARFILALKVALAAEGDAAALVFDEVDRGVGGAVADAVGERLAQLAARTQVLVVTHSPQVAARAGHHVRIEKSRGKTAVTAVTPLDAAGRREEIARMLAGAEVTAEARAAADRLLAEAGQ